MTFNTTQHGYLLIADISGYTSFIAQTELEHAQDILSELLELIIERFKTRFTIHKIEGDAIFAYTPETHISRGETLFELIETTYLAFRDRRDATHRRTTCACNACRNIPNLDLKFIAHHGDYFIQDIAGTKELVGSDVNLIHRLLKNRVSEVTGWRAYALFTAECLEHLSLRPNTLHEQRETYEHLGDISTLSMDLHARCKEMQAARRVVISPEEAHHIFEYDYHAAPAILWEWFNDPFKRECWMTSEIIPISRIRGRNGAGARNHCVHGKNQVIVEDVLDLHPYDYFTVAHTPQGMHSTLKMTFAFQPIDSDNTHLRLFFKASIPGMPEWLEKQFCKFILRTQVFKYWKLASINDLIARDLNQT